jgi:ribosomal protein S12 methylthiotransferase
MRFYVHKLGCPKNDVDADYITARVIAEGNEYVTSTNKADVIIVNTCGFIQPAKEESINEILRLSQLKQTGSVRRLYATGCLSQRYGDELLAEIPELDGAFGHGALDSLARAVATGSRLERSVRVDSRRLGYLSWSQRHIGDSLPYAYLKISDGCDRACTYCAIPGMRGKFRSRPLESIVKEAQFLSENGKKELILVSQEATMYGYDLPGSPTIVDLLKLLDELPEIRWLRLMYLYPPKLDLNVIEYLADDNKTLNYFDLPLQHVNTRILTDMRRRMTDQQVADLIKNIRKVAPDATVRTTFIIGFPGETEEEFEELCNFVEETQFERMGAFTYSQEEGTPSAGFSDQVPEEIKLDRLDRLMSLQRQISFERNESLVDSIQEVLIDSAGENDFPIGRTRGDCPEIDQEVRLTHNGIPVGAIVKVMITGTDGFDLSGEVVGAVS